MNRDKRWYKSEHDIHNALKCVVDEILSGEKQRINEQQGILKLYRNRDRNRVLVGGTSRNVIRSIVRTVHSRLIGMKPVPFYCSEGGDVELRERLELLNTAVAGLFLSTGFEDKFASLWCLHGILFGTGFVKAYASNGAVTMERVYPWEVLVDPLDGLYGEPSSLYQLRWVDRPVLEGLYPGKKYREFLSRSVGDRPDWAWWVSSVGEPVRLIEAWHLPDENGKGGRHVLATDYGTLLDEPYNEPDFPIIPFHYSDAEEGFWPDGVGQSLFPRQLEINRITEAVRETIRRCAWPRVFIPEGSAVPENMIDNTIGAIIPYQGGVPPQTVASPPLTREAVAYLSDLVASCYEDEGVSQFAASAQKPVGLQSGRALRIYADQQDGRLRDPGEKWTAARTRLGAALIRAQRAASLQDPSSPILFTSVKKKSVTRIVWKDVDITDEDIKLVAQPVSSLPQTPAAKAAMLEELYNSGSGVITLEEYRDGLDLPDVTALTEGAKAPRRCIEGILDQIVQTGIYAPPEPFFDLDLARVLGLQRYCQQYNEGAPEPILGLLRRWCMDVRDQQLQQAAAAAAAQQQIMPDPDPDPASAVATAEDQQQQIPDANEIG